MSETGNHDSFGPEGQGVVTVSSRVSSPTGPSSPQRKTAPLPGKTTLEPVQLSAFRRIRLLRILTTTWFSYAAYCMARRPFSVARSTIAEDLGLTVSDCVAVDTSFLVMYTVGQLIYGPFQQLTRLSAPDLLFVGLAGACVSLGALTVSQSVEELIVAWGFHGFVQAVGWSSCLVVVTPWLARGERGTVMGVWGTMAASGAVFGNVFTPAIMDETGSWRFAVAGIAAMMISIDLLTRLVVAQTPDVYGYPRQDVAPATPQQPTGAATEEELRLAALVLKPGVLEICLSYFTSKLVRYVLALWLPYYFTKIVGHTSAVAGIIASAFDIGGVFGSILSGYASDRYQSGQRRTEFVMLMTGGMVATLGGFSFGALFANNAYYSFVVTFFLGGFAYAIDSVVTGTLLQDFAERAQINHSLGALAGLVGGIGTLGSVFQGPLVAIITAKLSWQALFFALQILSGAGALVLINPLRLERLTNLI